MMCRGAFEHLVGPILLSASSSDALLGAMQIWDMMSSNNLLPDALVATSILSFCYRTPGRGSTAQAMKICDAVLLWPPSDWSMKLVTMTISSLCKLGRLADAMWMLTKSSECDIRVPQPVYTALLCACRGVKDLGSGEKVYE